MVIKNKKSQFLILSILVFSLFLIFIYSIETENTYIIKKSKINMLDNIMTETCMIGKLSNGSFIENRFSNFTNDISNYCLKFNTTCNLNITNIDLETNLSILNYKNFSYYINYSNNNYNYFGGFNC